MKKAIVLLSGGLDSSTVLYFAKEQGFDVHALTFDYGQRHRHELEAAARVARAANVTRHEVIKFDLRRFGGSALTSDIAVPKRRDVKSREVPITYVPARNTVFLSFALAWGEVVGAQDLFLGVNAVDFSGYPDCRPEFIEAFERLASVATKQGQFRIQAPLIAMDKADIVREARRLGVDVALTSSCYDVGQDGRACGECDACQLRLDGFQRAGCSDTIPYRNRMIPCSAGALESLTERIRRIERMLSVRFPPT